MLRFAHLALMATSSNLYIQWTEWFRQALQKMASYRERCSCIEPDINLGSIDNCLALKVVNLPIRLSVESSTMCLGYLLVTWNVRVPPTCLSRGSYVNPLASQVISGLHKLFRQGIPGPKAQGCLQDLRNGRPEMEWNPWCVCSDVVISIWPVLVHPLNMFCTLANSEFVLG